ncbi:MAG: hypothetical protein QGH45_22280 [Myxococcota bacterium]|nr:hypothetical protein [Myxococcota bacterium]
MKLFSAEPGDFALLAVGEAPFGVFALGIQPTGVVAVGVIARGLLAISCGMSVGVLALSCGLAVGVLAYGIGGLVGFQAAGGGGGLALRGGAVGGIWEICSDTVVERGEFLLRVALGAILIGGLIAGAYRLTGRMELGEDAEVSFGQLAPGDGQVK